MENKNEFQTTIILGIVGILMSVFAIAADAIVQKVNSAPGNAYIILYISVLAIGVLYFASSTTKKQGMLDVINLITNILLIVFGVVISIVEYILFTKSSELYLLAGSRFAVGLTILVISILKLVYYFISRNNQQMRNVYRIITIMTVSLVGAYLAIMIAHDSITAYRANLVPQINLFILIGTILLYAIVTFISPRTKVVEKN